MTLKKTFVKLDIEFMLFRARADKFRLIDSFKVHTRIGWFVTLKLMARCIYRVSQINRVGVWFEVWCGCVVYGGLFWDFWEILGLGLY